MALYHGDQDFNKVESSQPKSGSRQVTDCIGQLVCDKIITKINKIYIFVCNNSASPQMQPNSTPGYQDLKNT